MLIILLAFILTLPGCLWIGSEAKPPDNPGENGEEEPDPEEEARRREEEWRKRNAELKEELGPYYVPLPHPDQLEEKPRVKARAVYLTGHSAGRPDKMEQIIQLIEETELNAVVIDIKDDNGKMSYQSEIEAVNDIDAYFDNHPIADIRATLKDLKERGIYAIGRIVVFRDIDVFPTKKPEWCIPLKSGGIYRDKRGFAYGNPFIEELWDYHIAIAKEAALLGFDEIQFDYIRFPDNAAYLDKVVDFPGRNGRAKAEAIRGFVEKARRELAPYNVYLAYDVFGVVATYWGDKDDIGQRWEDFPPNCDYICPMIYPGHYGPYWFGLEIPNNHPKATITAALTDALKHNALVNKPAIIRPWLQAHDATWLGAGRYIHYGPAQIREQIDAARALGIDEYMLWDASNKNYPREAFFSEAEAERRYEQARQERESKGHDLLGRTARKAAEAYLEALAKLDWMEAYPLQQGFKGGYGAYRDWLLNVPGRVKEWRIGGVDNNGNKAGISLSVTLTLDGEEISLDDEKWSMLKENNVWRVKPSSRFLEIISGESEASKGQEQ